MANAGPRPWKMFLPLILVIVLAVAWSIYWLTAVELAKQSAATERQQLLASGLSLECKEESWGGYPFRIEYECRSPHLRSRDRAEISSGKILLVALAYKPWQIVALIDGPTNLKVPGLTPRAVHHQRAIASMTLDGKGDPDVSIDISQLTVPDLLTADRLMVHTRMETQGAIGVAVSIEMLNYQPTGRPDFLIDQGILLGSLSSSMALAIENVELIRNTVRYWGKGEVSLDSQNRLAGKLSTETNDVDGLIGLMEPHLDMTDQQKTNLKTVLGLLGNEAKADIVAKDGTLWLGPFKVRDLPPFY